MNRRRRRTGLAGAVAGIGLLVLLTLAVHFTYAIWPWPETARGSGALREAVLVERARVETIADEAAIRLIGTVIEWTYRITFEWTGLDSLMQPDDNGVAGRMSRGLRGLTETFYWSIQLTALRLGVLLVSLPLFLAALVAGAVDGAAAWYLRRSSVGRESGFIYHRAKFALWMVVFALWLVYLVPPVPLDPVKLIPPFVFLFGVGVRFTVSWFKKYI